MLLKSISHVSFSKYWYRNGKSQYGSHRISIDDTGGLGGENRSDVVMRETELSSESLSIMKAGDDGSQK